ncbi:MAG: AraC family transcriptional regulator [Planctomycetes bacterium]|nr:AraC family transcriptional regulator [Planctomycetota bacterium]
MAVARLRSSLIPALGAQLFVNQPRHSEPSGFHDHAFHEIAVVIGGGAVHRTIHGDEAIARGDVLVVHPGQWHGYTGCADLDLYNLCLAPALLATELGWARHDPLLARLLPTPGADPGQQVRRLRLDEDDLGAVSAALARMIALGGGREPLLARAEAIGHATVVLGRLARHLPRGHVAVPGDHPLQELAAAMDAAPARAWGLDELAARAGCSREHLCRRFRVLFGAAPLAWLARRRAERAAVLLLSTDAPVADIGRQVGWGDPNLFARRFRALLGLTPSVFRQRNAAT